MKPIECVKVGGLQMIRCHYCRIVIPYLGLAEGAVGYACDRFEKTAIGNEACLPDDWKVCQLNPERG